MKNLKKGFTLVEMLIVVVIIGLLAGVLIPQIRGVLATSRDTSRKAALTQIAHGIERYNLEKGKYPDSMPNASATKDVKGLSADLVPMFVKTMPKDPTKSPFKIMGYSNSPVSIEESFGITNTWGQYFLVTKVEQVDSANWMSGHAFPNNMQFCNKVTIDANDATTDRAACTAKKDSLIYVQAL